jgi:hypothetical protein
VALAASAALILLTVFIVRRSDPVAPQVPVIAHGPDHNLPAPIVAASRPADAGSPKPRAGERPRRANLAANRAVVAAVNENEDTNFSAIAALSGPASIEVPRIQAPAAASLPSFAPEPMTIRALEVSALPETLRERREE